MTKTWHKLWEKDTVWQVQNFVSEDPTCAFWSVRKFYILYKYKIYLYATVKVVLA